MAENLVGFIFNLSLKKWGMIATSLSYSIFFFGSKVDGDV
jgi:hypothetical protein